MGRGFVSGYTPVFDTVFSGSLYGRYPDTAAWLFMLAMADWQGHIDRTAEYIAGVTGMPLADLKGCIDRFMAPDPNSRSQVEEGRKLVLIDPSRSWGWKVVNIGLYREKARERQRSADGRNAEKQRRYRERNRNPALPDVTPINPTQTQTKTKERAALPPPVLREGVNSEAWTRWLEYRKAIKKPLKPASIPAAMTELASFGADQGRVVEKSIANGWLGLFPMDEKRATKKPLTVKIGDREWAV
jgi:hypothetical protein